MKFVDREANYPNRYRVVRDDGSAYYVTLERADDPTILGTPLNAEMLNTLVDEIETHKHSASDLTSGSVSVVRGGTGSGYDMSNAPNNAIIRRLKTDAYDQLYFIKTGNGAFYAEEENGLAKFGTLPMKQGGTGTSFSYLPPYAIIRATSDMTAYPYLYYQATGNGAFYATGENGAPRFGTLPVAQGGIGRASVGTGNFLVGNGASALVEKTPAEVLEIMGGVSPRMELGTEYRTTERYNGEVVYTKLVYFGNMPASTMAGIAHNADVKQIIRCAGVNVTLGTTLDSSTNEFPDAPLARYWATKTQVCIRANTDCSAYQAQIQIWYTKN